MATLGQILTPWSPPQRAVMIVLLAGLFVYGSIRLYFNRGYISDPQPADPPHAAELADKIDPNSADADTLAVLPLIGPKRAAEIVSFREQYQKEHPNDAAFKSLTDLLKIRGIGAATIDQLKPYLIFPTETPNPAIQQTTKPLR